MSQDDKEIWYTRRDRFFFLRSRLDNAILETILRASGKYPVIAEYGLAIRNIRFVFGGYKPKNKGKLDWLTPIHRELVKIGIIEKSYSRYSPQVVWNHCNKLQRMGALNRKPFGYVLVPEVCNYLGDVRHLKHKIRIVKQEECRTNGTVTVMGISKLENLGLNEKEVQNWTDEFTKLTFDMMKKSHKHHWDDFDIFPYIIINPNHLQIFWPSENIDSVKREADR